MWPSLWRQPQHQLNKPIWWLWLGTYWWHFHKWTYMPNIQSNKAFFTIKRYCVMKADFLLFTPCFSYSQHKVQSVFQSHHGNIESYLSNNNQPIQCARKIFHAKIIVHQSWNSTKTLNWVIFEFIQCSTSTEHFNW